MPAPYLLHDAVTQRYYVAPEGRQAHGDWRASVTLATEYPTRAAAEATARSIGGRFWRRRLAVITRPVPPAPRRQLVIPAFAKGFL